MPLRNLGSNTTAIEHPRITGMPRARGAICFTWDDGYPSWQQLIVPLANQLGQKHTFCVTSNRIDVSPFGMTSANIAAWHTAGHEITSHTVDHARMSDLTSAQRTAEYDDSKAAIEAIVGAGNVTTFTYPYGSSSSARSSATDEELRFRYERVLDTGPFGVYPINERAPFLIDRRALTTKASALQLIRLAAENPVIIVVYGHAVDEDVSTYGLPAEYNPAGSWPWADVAEMMTYASTLGVPCLTVQEAFTNPLPVMNGSFESDLAAWTVQNASANDVVDVVTTTPDTGLFGTKAARLKKVDNTTAAIAVKQLIPVRPGRSYALNARVNVVTGPTNTNVGSWAARLKMESLRGADLKVVATVAQTVTPAVADYGTWKWVTTTAWTCPSDVYAVQVSAFTQIGTTSQAPLPEVYFDHIYLEEVPYSTQTLTVPDAAVPLHASTHLPSGTDPLSLTNIQTFTAPSTTWTKPTGAKWVSVVAIGPGSGGGSGARTTSGTACSGGSGGAAGGMSVLHTPADALPASLAVLIGAGGAGGAAQTTNSTAGNAGSAAVGATQFGIYCVAGRASAGGGGGGIGAGSTGGTIGTGAWNGGAGANGPLGAAGSVPTGTGSSAGGGSGGGISTTPAAFAGGAGGVPTSQNSAAGTAGASGGGAGGNGTAATGQASSGGGGGGSSITGAGGDGGNGGGYGAGGGGGGSSLNGSASGKGGDGNNGLVIVVTYF